jgi:hypothetical protein
MLYRIICLAFENLKKKNLDFAYMDKFVPDYIFDVMKYGVVYKKTNTFNIIYQNPEGFNHSYFETDLERRHLPNIFYQIYFIM